MIRVFSTGRVRQKRGARGLRRYLTDDWSDTTLPVNVFLVEHPAGFCLVDAGQTAAAAKPGYFPSWYPFFRLSRFELSEPDEVSAQLHAAGITPEQVRIVVLTHMHTDHVGGIAAFTNSDVVVSRTEWQAAQGIGGRLRGYLPQFWPSRIQPRVVDFTGPAVGPFPASFDIASDGRLLLVPLPGHTSGHAALLVRDANSPAFLLAGDAVIRAADLERDHPAIAKWCEAERIVVLTCHDEAAADLVERANSAASIASR